ncbi:MAG TPA: hypothetical protein VHY09_02920, partial [Candidatus Methylacidiphilales bacterium]|nr:hypothetical protein [Candidatus Methylacidiphilales bacterium]
MNRLHLRPSLHICHTLAALTLLSLSSAGSGLRANDAASSTPPPIGEVLVKYTNGFETPSEQRLIDGHYKGAVSIDTTEAHSGKASLKIERNDQTQEVYWRSLGVG